jgi:hypothetical protein
MYLQTLMISLIGMLGYVDFLHYSHPIKQTKTGFRNLSLKCARIYRRKFGYNVFKKEKKSTPKNS